MKISGLMTFWISAVDMRQNQRFWAKTADFAHSAVKVRVELRHVYLRSLYMQTRSFEKFWKEKTQNSH